MRRKSPYRSRQWCENTPPAADCPGVNTTLTNTCKLCRIDIGRSEKLYERINRFVLKITSGRKIEAIHLETFYYLPEWFE